MMQKFRAFWASDLGILCLIAAVRLLLHTLTNHQYGWHRDELAMLDNARSLAWGYVAYPPLVPAIARLGLELFGPSLVGIRFFSALAQCTAMVLTGLMARELGGQRFAQITAALAAGIAPISLLQGALFQYVSFDYLWWVVVTYLSIRLLHSGDERWWLTIGAAIGLGMMSKYTMAFLVIGLVGGVLLTSVRRDLTNRWLWAGVALSLLIVAPNLWWQAQHGFISLEFLRSINARDVALGRTEGFLPEQFFVATNPITIPLWLAGWLFYAVLPSGQRYRLLSWIYVITLALFLLFGGRSYYLAPAYPMLLAAGATTWATWLQGINQQRAQWLRRTTYALLILGALLMVPVMLPVAPINSALWELSSELQDNFVEQIGWPELTANVADIYQQLPTAEREQTAILTGNYGEAGALNLYGPAHGLPRSISGMNSYWLRGYGSPASTVIVLGFTAAQIGQFFAECTAVGRVTNPYDVENEEYNGEIFLCRQPRYDWSTLWPMLRNFG